MIRVDQGADAGGGQARIANRHLADSGAHLGEEFGLNRSFDQNTGASEADLTGVDLLAGNRLGGGIEIGIGADDEG